MEHMGLISVVPAAVAIILAFKARNTIFSFATVAAVAGGGVFGDHCSPLSDTTILASCGAASDHIDHVKTQIPYAALAAVVALVVYLILGFIIA